MVLLVVQRLLQALAVMLVMSAVVFAGVYAIGNPIDVLISPDADQVTRLEVIERFGLDRPLWEQYFTFLRQNSRWRFRHLLRVRTPVVDVIADRIPATTEMVVLALGAATVVGVPLGMYAGYRPHSSLARAIMALSVLGFSVPTFWMASS